MTKKKPWTIRFFHFNGIHFEPLGRERLDRCQLELIRDAPPFLILHFKFDQRTSHIIVMSLLRFGFRFLEKDEDERKDVEERNLGIQEVKEENQTASKDKAKMKH